MADRSEAAGEAWMRGDLSSRAYFEMARRRTRPTPAVRWLLFLPRSFVDGVAALRDLLLWGHVYPRAVSLKTLQRMRGRR